MALRDTMTANLQPHLQPGEQLQAVIGAQTHSQWLMAATGALPFIFINRYLVVAATDRRIAVFDAGRWGMKKPRELVRELPRSTRLGPGSGMWHPVEVGGKKMRVHRRFFKDLDAADAAVDSA